MSDDRQILPEDPEEEVVGEIPQGEVARVVNLAQGILASAKEPSAIIYIDQYKQVVAKKIAMDKYEEKLASGEHFLTKEHKQRVVEAKKKSAKSSFEDVDVSVLSFKRREEVVKAITSQFLTGLSHLHQFDRDRKSEYEELKSFVSDYIREPSEKTRVAFSGQLEKMKLKLDTESSIEEIQKQRAIHFAQQVIEGDALAVIKEYKEEMRDSYGLSSEEVINKMIDLFKEGLGQLYDDDFEDEKFNKLFSIAKNLIISSDSSDGDKMIAEEMGKLFKKQWKELASTLTLLEDEEEVEETEQVKDIELGLPDKAASLQVGQLLPKETKKSVTIAELDAKSFIQKIQALKTSASEYGKKKSASFIHHYISSYRGDDQSTLSRKIIDQYKLDRALSSGELSLSSKDMDLQGFVSALIGEVRKKIKDEDADEAINEFITQAVIDFNEGRVNYTLWASAMNQAEEERAQSIQEAVSKAKNAQTREHRRALSDIQYALTSSEGEVKDLKETVQARELRIKKMEKEKKEAKESYDAQIELKEQEIKREKDEVTKLKVTLREQKDSMEQSHTAQMKEKEQQLQEKAEKIENLERTIRNLEKQIQQAPSPSSKQLSEIAQLRRDLEVVKEESRKKDEVIAEKEASLLSLATKKEQRDEKATPLADELLRKENSKLQRRVLELEAAAVKPLEEKKDSVLMPSPEPVLTINSLKPLIIALGTFEAGLRGKVESKENKESLARVSGLIERLTVMQTEEKTDPENIIAVTKECAGVISTLHPGLVLSLPESSASYASVVDWIQQAVIQVQKQERSVLPPAVSPEDLTEMQNLAYCIDKIILPTLMMQSGNTDDEKTIESEKKAINQIDKIYKDLHAGTLDSKALGSVKNYVRIFLKDYCLSSINDMHKNKAGFEIIERMSVRYNTLVSEAEITATKLKLISDEIAVETRIGHGKNAKSVTKNDAYFTDKDFSIILAALQAEGMGDNGWKIDNKKLKEINTDRSTEFTIPLMLEKRGGLLWSNKQSVALKFSKTPDGGITIINPSKKGDALSLIKRIEKNIKNPKEVRKLIDKDLDLKRTALDSKPRKIR